MNDKKVNLNDIRYVLFDMDGTLLNSKKEVSQKTIETIIKLRNLGIKCGIATGRPYYFARNEIKAITPDFPIVSCNGALIYDYKNDQLLFKNPIDKTSSNKIFKLLVEKEATFLVYTSTEIFSYKKNSDSKWFEIINNINNSFEEKHRVKISSINNMESFNIDDYDVIKFLVVESEIPKSTTQEIVSSVENINGVYWVLSQKDIIDIMPESSNKGQGLQELANQEFIDLNHTIVFGDAANDIPMFKIAKYSVAMGQAIEELKSIATDVTNDNNSEGIYNYFDKLIK